GRERPSGYTELILTARRWEAKATGRSEGAGQNHFCRARSRNVWIGSRVERRSADWSAVHKTTFAELVLGTFELPPGWKVISTPEEATMDWNRVEGNWRQFKGKAKEKWGKLTDDDLNVIEGRREQLEGKLQQRYGFAKDQIHKDVDDWFRTLK